MADKSHHSVEKGEAKKVEESEDEGDVYEKLTLA